MKNIDIIKSAFEAHKNGDLQQAEKLSKRIAANFNLQDDDYAFSIISELYQSCSDVSRELVKDSRSMLNGDESLPQRVDLKIAIDVNVVNGGGSLRVVFDDEGIRSITQQRVGQFRLYVGVYRKDVNEIVENWLETEFRNLKLAKFVKKVRTLEKEKVFLENQLNNALAEIQRLNNG